MPKNKETVAKNGAAPAANGRGFSVPGGGALAIPVQQKEYYARAFNQKYGCSCGNAADIFPASFR